MTMPEPPAPRRLAAVLGPRTVTLCCLSLCCLSRCCLSRCCLSLCCVLLCGAARAQTLDAYLGEGEYLPGVPRPAAVIGHEVGEWHVRPDSIVRYFHALGETSPRIRVETYGRTHERHELILATVSSPANLERLDEIRERHRSAALEGKVAADLPVVVWLGYSVHGNEPSGGNAALLVAYHLAAAAGSLVESLLERSIILIDPCINPDGFGRFARWANGHRGARLVADPGHREHVEPWPNGRTNHYWFDLNRDWLLLVHPESRARIERFHDWLPNVVGDFHEMGRNSTYFFQPGVPERQHPLAPERGFDLTAKLATYHARALDRIGSLYFTKQIFDDFYFGKGSTYADVHGAIGILFEQAGARGHLQESDRGLIDFPFTIRNQYETSLSTVRGAVEIASDLREHQRSFFAEAARAAAADRTRAFVFGGQRDTARTALLAGVLHRHRIRVHALAAPVDKAGFAFRPGDAFVVPVEQPQYTLLRALFEKRTSFAGSTFYDVSAWTFPLAYDVPVAELDSSDGVESLLADPYDGASAPSGRLLSGDDPYAYLIDWDSYWAPKAAYRLLERGVRVQATMSRMTIRVVDGPRRFERGTLIVPRGIQDLEPDAVHRAVVEAATESGVVARTASSGLAAEGVDLGSPDIRSLRKPIVALIVGPGVSAYEAGEAWFTLDHRFGIPVSLVDVASAARTEWSRYTHIVLVDGNPGGLDRSWGAIRDWVGAGGILIAQRGGAALAERHLLSPPKEGEADAPAPAPSAADFRTTKYADYERLRNEERISGAIFAVRVDTTHPLAYGYARDELPVFRSGTATFAAPKDPFSVVAYYPDEPLLAGYASPDKVAKIAGTPSLIATRVGRGCVIRFADNPNFRGFWHGTTKLFLNAILFGGTIAATAN